MAASTSPGSAHTDTQYSKVSGVSVSGQQGEPAEQQVERTRSTRPRRERPDGAADLQQDAPSAMS
jgi:hypothetical protein